MRYFLSHEPTPSNRALAARIRQAFATGESVKLKALRNSEFAALLYCIRSA